MKMMTCGALLTVEGIKIKKKPMIYNGRVVMVTVFNGWKEEPKNKIQRVEISDAELEIPSFLRREVIQVKFTLMEDRKEYLLEYFKDYLWADGVPTEERTLEELEEEYKALND